MKTVLFVGLGVVSARWQAPYQTALSKRDFVVSIDVLKHFPELLSLIGPRHQIDVVVFDWADIELIEMERLERLRRGRANFDRSDFLAGIESVLGSEIWQEIAKRRVRVAFLNHPVVTPEKDWVDLVAEERPARVSVRGFSRDFPRSDQSANIRLWGPTVSPDTFADELATWISLPKAPRNAFDPSRTVCFNPRTNTFSIGKMTCDELEVQRAALSRDFSKTGVPTRKLTPKKAFRPQ